MASTRRQFIDLIKQDALAPKDIQKALTSSGLYPGGADWYRFLDRLLLWMASLALAASVVFFVAYNWDAWGRFARFGIVEVAILLAVAAYVRWEHHRIAAQAALLAATLSLGALLALVGQVYQTGADPWQLFFAWAVLMLPWALLGRAVILWVVWVALLNLSGVLYFQSFGLFGLMFESAWSMYWLLFLFNVLVLGVWEAAALRWTWLAVDWARRLVAVAAGTAITWLTLLAVFNDRHPEAMPLLAYGLWLAGLYVAYRRWRLDLFMLAGGCLSATLVVTALLARYVFEGNEMAGFGIIALVILGLGAASAHWLNTLHKEVSA
ncbi:DUF2157 domain-containing protein [Saccharospirillum salsuginis]|uniref:DUF2157 domain-containing protein n=1 Tax=Saccharospirillum salsuginis TaxID=418750 RepID=A0A918K2H6_9GAMM|nr:DUF2157 domain-containing protein [Saccharospirillum salsuginis]GGX43832.1 hypothetical protein GCM10007392_08230 [Saccharospirillum salsuginis]